MAKVLGFISLLICAFGLGCDKDEEDPPTYTLSVTVSPDTVRIPTGEAGSTMVAINLRLDGNPLGDKSVGVWLGDQSVQWLDTDANGRASINWVLDDVYGRFRASAAAIPTFTGYAASGETWVTVVP